MSLVDQIAAAQLPSLAKRRQVRVSAGASLRDFGAELGVTPMTVLRWERGESEPRRSHAIAYRRLLEQIEGAMR